MTLPRNNMIYRERHCPPEDEKLHCLIPAPKGYKNPFPWPKKEIGPKSMSLMVERVINLWSNMELWNIFKTTAPSPRKGYCTKNVSRRSTMNPCPHMFFPPGAVSFAWLSICEFLVQNQILNKFFPLVFDVGTSPFLTCFLRSQFYSPKGGILLQVRLPISLFLKQVIGCKNI